MGPLLRSGGGERGQMHRHPQDPRTRGRGRGRSSHEAACQETQEKEEGPLLHTACPPRPGSVAAARCTEHPLRQLQKRAVRVHSRRKGSLAQGGWMGGPGAGAACATKGLGRVDGRRGLLTPIVSCLWGTCGTSGQPLVPSVKMFACPLLAAFRTASETGPRTWDLRSPFCSRPARVPLCHTPGFTWGLLQTHLRAALAGTVASLRPWDSASTVSSSSPLFSIPRFAGSSRCSW